jgi:hypothetical protein
MITILILSILLYSYSVYRIKKDCGSWENFNPFESNFLFYIGFLFGNSVIVLFIIALLLYVIKNNILP